MEGVTIEVQLRTLLQHWWADRMERLADMYGRQIRYGEPPVAPAGSAEQMAQTAMTIMMLLSERFADLAITEVDGKPFPLEKFMEDDTISDLRRAVRGMTL
jgi:ppGpp synthetase/RelA/SpoT-type nucleotidyltranferase